MTASVGGARAQVAAAPASASAARLLGAGALLPFLNRERELAALEGALGRAIAGQGRLVTVSGEPGIGKSRLVAELAASAEAPGRWAQVPRVVVSRCWDGGTGPSLWPWSTIVRDLCAESDADELRELIGAGAPSLGALVPELRSRLPELGDAPPLESDGERFVLFDAIAGFMRRVADRAPLLVVLDDAHAGDRATLQALLFLTRQLPSMRVLLVATRREGEVRRSEWLSSLFAKLAREALDIALTGLSPDEIGRLIDHHAGSGGAALTEAIHDATGGNPFFADEAMRMLLARGQMSDVGRAELVPLSAGVQAVIEQRLAPLEADVLAALRYAAIAGNRFAHAVVVQASGGSRADTARALERAAAESLIRPRPGELGVYDFAHTLTRETIIATMTASEQSAAHRAVAAALERRYAGSVEFHLEELADHYLKALPAGDPEPAVAYAERAADHAMTLYAHERAARFYGAALEALDLLDEPAEGRAGHRARLLVGLGRADQRLGAPRARTTLLEAAAAARAAEADDLLAAAAMAFGSFGISPGTVDRELTCLLEDALDRAPSGSDALRIRLLGRLARALYWDPDPTRRLSLVDEAHELASSLGEPAIQAAALADCVMSARGVDSTEQVVAWIDAILSLPDAPSEAVVVARTTEVDVLLERGQIGAADAALDSLARHAHRLRDVRAQPMVPVHRARRAMIEGRFADAEAHLVEATELADRLEESTFPLTIGGGRVALDMLRGDFSRVHGRVAPLVEALPEMHLWRACVVAAHTGAGDLDAAARELERTVAAGLGAIPRDVMWLITMSLLADGIAAVGEDGLVAEAFEVLLPVADRIAISPQSGYRGPIARSVGLLAERQGDLEEARAHLGAALASTRRHRARPMQAQVAVDLARVLAACPDGGDGPALPEAATLLDEAEQLCAELELRHLDQPIARVRAEIGTVARAADVPAEPARAELAALAREGEVWTFTLGRSVVRVRDSKGVRHLAELLARPGEPIHALALGGAESERASASVTQALATGELALVDMGGGSGPALDDAAKAAYRRRLVDLRDELDEAERWNDPERAARARQEVEFITAELAAAVGLGGRDRPQHAAAERARVNVTRAIRTAIGRVADADGGIGAELKLTIHTGAFCTYEPDPRRPLRWTVTR